MAAVAKLHRAGGEEGAETHGQRGTNRHVQSPSNEMHMSLRGEINWRLSQLLQQPRQHCLQEEIIVSLTSLFPSSHFQKPAVGVKLYFDSGDENHPGDADPPVAALNTETSQNSLPQTEIDSGPVLMTTTTTDDGAQRSVNNRSERREF